MRQQCAGLDCGRWFSSDHAWEQHRKGPHPRTCLDPASITRKDGSPALVARVAKDGRMIWTGTGEPLGKTSEAGE